MRIRSSVLLLPAALWLAGCGASSEAVATSVAATLAAIPTATPIVAVVEITAVPRVQPPTAPPASATPSPGPTVTPTPTATPTLAETNPKAGLDEPSFQDDFRTAAGWSVYDDESSSVVITEGRLDFTVKTLPRFAWIISARQGVNFYAEIKASPQRCAGADSYGLLFRARPADGDGYFFLLSCDGRYQLLERLGGEVRPLIDWTARPEINIGADASNLLGVRAEGERMTLFVNDQVLADPPASTDFPGGSFGLYAGAAVTQNVLVAFDDLRIWNLP
ncbi:MAG: hypothetical protein HY784_08700 [Chloroflexi bacterium]|nr:hypothetical protein [Chloroflexota bacterium]